MKRLVFCFDGTWNKLASPLPTNVVVIAESVFPSATRDVSQIIHYDDGVGTGGDDWKWKQLFEYYTGGILGAGLVDNIREAYRFIIFNYEPGDQIYVFGFSRGAYTARSFIGLLNAASIIDRRDAAQIDRAVELYRNRLKTDLAHKEERWRFRAEHARCLVVSDEEDAWRAQNCPGHVLGSLPRLSVSYLGVWDTVGAMGLPAALPGARRFNARHQFHDSELPRFVEAGRHAVALDERRRSFPVTRWENVAERNQEKGFDWTQPDAPVQEQWFPGTHGSVGGGGDIRGLSDAALAWVVEGARAKGLELDTSASSRVFELAPNHRAPLVNTKSGPDFTAKYLPKRDRSGPDGLHQVHVAARRRWCESPQGLPEKVAYRPASLLRIAGQMDALCPTMPSAYTGPILARHVVVRGDTLQKLARKYLGSASLSVTIFEANRGSVIDPDELFVGTELIIPALEDGSGPAKTASTGGEEN